MRSRRFSSAPQRVFIGSTFPACFTNPQQKRIFRMNRFDGRTVLVTGAGSGIGAACVRRLFAEGASVVAGDVREQDLQAVVAEFDGSERVHGMRVDVADREQVAAFVSGAAKRYGKLHGLVNCAGIRGVGSILDFDHDAWRRVIAVNLEGVFYTCQEFARVAKDTQTPAAIVNVTSAAGLRGVPNRFGYVASKFGVSGATMAMALDLAPLGIRVNAVAPGMIRTPMTSPMFEDPDNVERIRAAHPIGRAGEPEEIAAAIAFLLSDDASFIVGVVLPVDGGVTTGIPSH